MVDFAPVPALSGRTGGCLILGEREFSARRALVRLLAECAVREALADHDMIHSAKPEHTPNASRPIRPIQLRPAAADLDH